MQNKILSLEEVATTASRLKKQGKTIAHCHGCFDLLHPGHIKHFEAAKKIADVVIVTLTPDIFVNNPDKKRSIGTTPVAICFAAYAAAPVAARACTHHLRLDSTLVAA